MVLMRQMKDRTSGYRLKLLKTYAIMGTTNKLMTLDGLIERLREIREDIGHDCDVHMRMLRGNKIANVKIEMACSDYKDGEDSAYIEIGYDELKWFEK